jgi:hypothetical protein
MLVDLRALRIFAPLFVFTAVISTQQTMSQIAPGGFWKTTFYITNTGDSSAQVHLAFFEDNGGPLNLPLSFPQANTAPISAATTLDPTLSPHALLVIETTGPDNVPPVTGSATLTTDGTIDAYAVFRQQIGTAPGTEALVPFEKRISSVYTMSFDNTSNGSTGIALVNLNSKDSVVAIEVRDDSGAMLATSSLSLSAKAHVLFDSAQRLPGTAQRRGTLTLRGAEGANAGAASSNISVLGIHFSSQGGISTIPPSPPMSASSGATPIQIGKVRNLVTTCGQLSTAGYVGYSLKFDVIDINMPGEIQVNYNSR